MCVCIRARAIPEDRCRKLFQHQKAPNVPLTRLCRVEDVSEDEPFQAVIEGYEPFAVFRAGDEFFVMTDKCNHAGASLSLEGRVERRNVICGWHDATFDLRTGAGLSGPCTGPMRVYPVTIDDGHVLIEL
jgi:nitrite reductase/ring-hydroxylating ferredoxin subunit